MYVSLLFDCGNVLSVPRCWLACSDVLVGALNAACDLGCESSELSASDCSLPLSNDKLEDWQLLLPVLEAVNKESSTEVSSVTRNPGLGVGCLDLTTASIILTLADKYNMRAVMESLEAFLSKQEYSSAAADSGDPSSIWLWLRTASRLSQPSLLQYYKQNIIEQRLVPTSTADVSGLHPTDMAGLLVSFMQQHADVRYKCLGCAGRHSTEVRLCSRCSFSPHIRV